jgi:hypothetical protein
VPGLLIPQKQDSNKVVRHKIGKIEDPEQLPEPVCQELRKIPSTV